MYAVHQKTKICTNYGIFSAYALERVKEHYAFKLFSPEKEWVDFEIEAFSAFRYPLFTLSLKDGTQNYMHGDSPVLLSTGESVTLSRLNKSHQLKPVIDYSPVEWYDDYSVPFKQDFTDYSEFKEDFLYLAEKRRRPYFDFILSKFEHNNGTLTKSFYSRNFVNDFSVMCKLYGYYPKISNELYIKEETSWSYLYGTRYKVALNLESPTKDWTNLSYCAGDKYSQNVYFISCKTFYALGQGIYAQGLT
jgi:hypothetical protein